MLHWKSCDRFLRSIEDYSKKNKMALKDDYLIDQITQ